MNLRNQQNEGIAAINEAIGALNKLAIQSDNTSHKTTQDAIAFSEV